MYQKFTLRGLFGILLLLFLANLVTVTMASEESTLTVANRTEHYLHIIIDGEAYLYVAPEYSVVHATPPKTTMLVSALYSPGQEIRGSVLDTVSVPYRGAQHGCTCTAETNRHECFYNPPTGGASRLEIYPEDLTP